MTGKDGDLTVPFLAMFNHQNYNSMKQYYVNVEGEVFALVKKEVAKCIFKKDKDMTILLNEHGGVLDLEYRVEVEHALCSRNHYHIEIQTI